MGPLSGSVFDLLADVTFVTEFVTSRFAPNAERKAQTEAFGLGNAWTTIQSISVPKISPLSGPVSEILADVTFVTEFVTSRFAPNAKRKAQASAFGLGIAWTTVQSICVPKISALSGPVSEILADVTFVTDGRTDRRTDGRTHTHINSENYIYRLASCEAWNILFQSIQN